MPKEIDLWYLKNSLVFKKVQNINFSLLNRIRR